MSQDTCIRVLADPVQIRQCKDQIKARQPSFARMSNLLSLAGSEVRLKILYLLESEGELCPCDLSDILQMTLPAISQHLRKMKDGGLVDARKVGQTIFYTVCKDPLRTISPILNRIKTSNEKQKMV